MQKSVPGSWCCEGPAPEHCDTDDATSAEKYDVILQEAVYVNPKHDITEKVLKILNSAK